MAFWTIKLVSQVFFPVPTLLILLGGGLFLLSRTKLQRAGRLCVAAAIVLLFVLGCPWFPRALTRRLERGVLPCTQPLQAVASVQRPAASGESGAISIVVLGTGFNPNPAYPINLQVDSGYWGRLTEGVRLQRALSGSRLLVSVAGEAAEAEKQAFLDGACAFLAVPPESVVLLADARTTVEEARLAAPLVADGPVFLVSDAMHLRRAVAVFRNAGVHAIPAPASISCPDLVHSDLSILSFIPSASHLQMSHRAIHETLGHAWERLRGRRH